MYLQSVQRPSGLVNCKCWVMLRNLTSITHSHDAANRAARLIVGVRWKLGTSVNCGLQQTTFVQDVY